MYLVQANRLSGDELVIGSQNGLSPGDEFFIGTHPPFLEEFPLVPIGH